MKMKENKKRRDKEMPKLSKRRGMSPSPRGQGEASTSRTCTEPSYWDFGHLIRTFCWGRKCYINTCFENAMENAEC
jgi:hypothetical protein